MTVLLGLPAVDGHWKTGIWRREWDSNPRYVLAYTRFPSVRLKPLGHPSGPGRRRKIAAKPDSSSATGARQGNRVKVFVTNELRVSSLIGVVGVKLFLSLQAFPVGHSLLFAVGAWPPHNGVRRARRLNLSRDLRGIAALRLRTLNEITSPIVPTGTTRLRLRQAETGTPLVIRLLPPSPPACPSGTRNRRSICGAG